MAFDRTLLWPGSSVTRRGPKPRLTLDEIVDAGIRIADTEGLAAVSMQHVADGIGATKMSIYRYVPSKAELTALMLDRRLGEPPSSQSGDSGWRSGLQEWAVQIHRRFSAAPWLLELAVGARVIGPNELAWLECGLAALAEAPLSGGEKLDALAVLSGHVRSLVQQQIITGETEEAIATLMTEIIKSNALRFPLTAEAFGDTGSMNDRDQALAFGIDRILDGIETLIDERNRLKDRRGS
jgi:AcrR family transcriptional regulator